MVKQLTTRLATLVDLGCHEGGTELFRQLARHGVSIGEATLVDPLPGRARDLAASLDELDTHFTTLEARGEDVFDALPGDGPIVGATDSVTSTKLTVQQADRRDVLTQGVLQAFTTDRHPGTVIGLNVNAFPERPRERQEATRFYEVLERLSPERRSSTNIRQRPFAARSLQKARSEAASSTVRAVTELERTREAETLAELFWFEQTYPLVLAERDDTSVRIAEEQAIHLVERLERGAVALMSDKGVEFVIIERDFGRPWVRHSVRFEQPPPAPAPVRARSGGRRPVEPTFALVFTD